MQAAPATGEPMGLDNIPATYPCVKSGTAVRNSDDLIDCGATQNAGGCPWQHRMASDHPGRPVYGMFGTGCWWRGKISHWHLDVLAEAGHQLPEKLAGGFYGADDHDPELSPAYCRDLADWLADHAEAFAAAVVETDDGPAGPEELAVMVDEYRYAVWWLRFVADTADGALAWW